MKDEKTHCIKLESYLKKESHCDNEYYTVGDKCIFRCPEGFNFTDLGEFICAKERLSRDN